MQSWDVTMGSMVILSRRNFHLTLAFAYFLQSYRKVIVFRWLLRSWVVTVGSMVILFRRNFHLTLAFAYFLQSAHEQVRWE